MTVNQTNQGYTGSLVTGLTLISPNGGEIWDIGTMHNITWIFSGLSGNIRIELWKANKKLRDIAANIPIVNGSFPWVIGQNSPGTFPTGNDYRIKIITANGLYTDISDGNFSIVNPGVEVRVKEPNRGYSNVTVNKTGQDFLGNPGN